MCEQQPIFQNLHEKLDKVPEAQELWAEGWAGLELGTPGEILPADVTYEKEEVLLMEEASFESLVCRGYEQMQGWLSPGLFLGTLCLSVPETDLLCWQAVGEKTLGEISVPVEMAQGVLQVLSNRFEGSNLCDLLNSHIYTKYGLLPKEPGHLPPSRTHSCTSEPEEGSESAASFSEKEESPRAEAEPAGAKPESPKAQSDSQLFNQLLVTEGMALAPETQEAATGEFGSGREGEDIRTGLGLA